jgi:hypothetical protein
MVAPVACTQLTRHRVTAQHHHQRLQHCTKPPSVAWYLPRLCPVSTNVQPLQSGSSFAACAAAAAGPFPAAVDAAAYCTAAPPLVAAASPAASAAAPTLPSLLGNTVLTPIPSLPLPLLLMSCCCCCCVGSDPSSSCSSRPRLRKSSLMARAQLRMPS